VEIDSYFPGKDKHSQIVGKYNLGTQHQKVLSSENK